MKFCDNCGDRTGVSLMYEPQLKLNFDRRTITFETIDEDGIELDVTLPAKLVVCDRCDGRGKFTPGVYTQDDFEQEGPDFIEDYMEGVFDELCPECKGRTTTLEVDRDNADRHSLRLFDEYIRDMAEMRAEYEAERRMGA